VHVPNFNEASKMVLMIGGRHPLRLLRLAFASVAVAMFAPGCSSQHDSLPEVGTAEEYVAHRQNNTSLNSYSPYGPCTAFDPYCCFTLYWYPGPIYYFADSDGDNDCDDGNCSNFREVGHHKPPVVSRAERNPPVIATSSTTLPKASTGFGSRVSSTGSALFSSSFGRGAFGGHGHR